MPPTLLVIPCFREKDRLPRFLPDLCAALAPRGDVRIRVVDDGSGPEQQAWMAQYVDTLRQDYPFLDPAQLNAANNGKGGCVYSGWDRPEGAERLAFVDADGAVPAREVARVLAASDAAPGHAVYAVRTGEAGTTVTRDTGRKIAGLVFRRLVKAFFHFPVPDTQCGCKLVPASAYLPLAPTLREHHFTFDVELTWQLLHRGLPIHSVPIDWTESPGSRLRPGSAWHMFRALRSLKNRLGDWRKPKPSA